MMRAQKRIYEMTEREYRAYKRARRQRRAFRRNCMILLATLCVVLAGSLSYHAIRSSAQEQESAASYKYYTGITVGYGDTLWDIADAYMDEIHYKDKAAYISEVCHINHLEQESALSPGQSLVVPYYLEEFVY